MNTYIKKMSFFLFFSIMILINFYALIRVQLSFEDNPYLYSVFEIFKMQENDPQLNINVISAYINIQLACFAGMLFTSLVVLIVNITIATVNEFITSKKFKPEHH